MQEPISREHILRLLANNETRYKCTQPKLCIPVIDRICRKMRAGIRFAEIKVDHDLICDGHHRYVASLLAGYQASFIPSTRTSATRVTEWESVDFETEDWDTPAKILMLNKLDAMYNDMSLETLTEIVNKG
ncbi:MAG: hypothetical protein QM664_14510 [Flavihumibacter sp.]